MARRFPTLLILAAGSFAAAGCSDAITFSKTERAEGRIALQEGDHEQAAMVFANQIRRNPRDYRAHFHLGEARWAAGRYPEALRSYKTALDVMALTPRGQHDEEYRHVIINEYARALAQVDTDGSQLAQIEKVSAGNKHKKLLIALTHAKAGRPDPAIGSFRSAMRLDRMSEEQDPQIAKRFGLYLESIRQNDMAREALRRAYALAPSDEEVAAALRRLGVIPGPAILSKNDLATPAMPLGPLPQVRLKDPDGEGEDQKQPQQAQPTPAAADGANLN